MSTASQPPTPPPATTAAPAEPTYDVVWPKSPVGVQARRSAPRLASLDGATVGFLWDHLFRGDELFPVLEKELTQRFDGIEIVGHEVFGNIHGADEHERIARLPADLQARHVDAVVSAMGC
ncbi:MAG: hypothetical protein AAGA93_13760 [Actinomycetota bacterium]